MLGISGLTEIPQMPKRTAYLPEKPYDPMLACRMSHHRLYCQTYMYCDYLPCRESQEIDHCVYILQLTETKGFAQMCSVQGCPPTLVCLTPAEYKHLVSRV